MKKLIAASALLCVAGAALAADPPRDCSGPEYRQFDFWIGKFEVRTPDGEIAGHFDGNYRREP